MIPAPLRLFSEFGSALGSTESLRYLFSGETYSCRHGRDRTLLELGDLSVLEASEREEEERGTELGLERRQRVREPGISLLTFELRERGRSRLARRDGHRRLGRREPEGSMPALAPAVHAVGDVVGDDVEP